MLPANSAAVVSASATAPCTAMTSGSWIYVMRQSGGTCQVHIELADGTAYTSTISFQALGGCCPDTYSGTASPIEQVDAGTGG